MQTCLHVGGLCHAGREIFNVPEQVLAQGADMPVGPDPEHFSQISVGIGVNYQHRPGFRAEQMPDYESGDSRFSRAAFACYRD
jgi:hypothetical protein